MIYKIKTREGLIFEVNDINSNLASGQIEFKIEDGQPGYRKPGADTVIPFSKGAEFIAMTIFHGSTMPTSNTACSFAAYNPDVISYDPNTHKITLKKACKIAVYMAHSPVGQTSNVTFSYKINENTVIPLMVAQSVNELKTGEISVQKDDSITFYYRCSMATRHFIVVELHCNG